jgi:drug/metabolite transporter (DMT)-like permease
MLTPNPTLAVLYSEFVLSLYPILIKSVNTNIFTQILARFIVFPSLALAFGSTYDFKSIWGSPYEAFVSIMNNLLNLGHIASSYTAFKILPVGTAIALFYLYPIFNVLSAAVLFGESLSFIQLVLISVAFMGTYLIATERADKTEDKSADSSTYKYGVIMGILAAITETMIFIFVRSNTDAQASPYYTVNHLYPAGLAMLLIYAIFHTQGGLWHTQGGLWHTDVVDTSKLNWLKLLGFNAVLGFTGYIARFYAIPKIPAIIFSLLSFFGVTFGNIWGVLYGEKVTMKSLVGGGLIVGATAVLRYSQSA